MNNIYNKHHITVDNSTILLYTVYKKRKVIVLMKIMINTSSMVPIYEQIIEQVKREIRVGNLRENDQLPSVRALSKELKISALTVKKAYDELEREGFTVTVHGKGSYVTATNQELMLEEQKRELEQDLEQVILKGRRYGISDKDMKSLFELILEG